MYVPINVRRIVSLAHESSTQRFAAFTAGEQAAASERVALETARSAEETAAVRTKLEELRGQIIEQLTELNNALVNLSGSPTGSAGGLVGREAEGVEHVSGHPWATGDVKWTHNPIAPLGWLFCDGTYRRKDDFPELHSVIGVAFDAAAGTDVFKLPSATDLGGALASFGNWMIRT